MNNLYIEKDNDNSNNSIKDSDKNSKYEFNINNKLYDYYEDNKNIINKNKIIAKKKNWLFRWR